MIREFPVGEHFHITEDAKLKNIFATTPLQIGLYNIRFSPPKNIHTPLLPTKATKGGLEWTLEDGEGWYTSVDVTTAQRGGYTILKVMEAYVWKRSACIFKEYVEMCYELKKESKGVNPALYQAVKLLLNSTYGKSLQKPIFSENVICVNQKEVMKFLYNHDWTGMRDFGKSGVLMQGEIHLSERNEKIRPIHLGAFILSYSREIVAEPLFVIDPSLSNLERMLYYTDTDSLILPNNISKDIASFIDDGMLGKLSNDLAGDAKIIQAYFLSPKLYALVYVVREGCNNKECIKIGGVVGDMCDVCNEGEIIHSAIKRCMKSKGIRQRCMKFEYYERMLRGESVCDISFKSLKKIHLNLTKKDVERGLEMWSLSNTSISRTLNKTRWEGRYRSNNSVLLPWGHNEIPISERREKQEIVCSPPRSKLSNLDTRQHVVYVVYTIDDSTSIPNAECYVGYTTDFERRLKQHRGELEGGAAYTKRWEGKVFIAFVVSCFESQKDGLCFEHLLKGRAPQSPLNAQHGGVLSSRIRNLMLALQDERFASKMRGNKVTIEWGIEASTVNVSLENVKCSIPIIFKKHLEIELRGKVARKRIREEWSDEWNDEPHQKRSKPHEMEGESENDDEVLVYDSDNDPYAEVFIPLNEGYEHEEVRAGEENEMDDFIIVDDEYNDDEEYVEI